MMVRKKIWPRLVPGAIALLLLAALPDQEEDYLAIRTVLVAVKNETGGHVAGLGINDFDVQERGVKRDIETVVSSEKQTEIMLAVDTSVAVTGQIQLIRRAVEDFVRAVTPQNKVSLYEFGGRAHRLVEFTPDAGTLIQAINMLHSQPSEGAYLLDTIIVTARDLAATEQQEGNPARIVIVTGDGPELSHYRHEQAKKAGEDSGAVYHVILIDSPSQPSLLAAELVHQAEVEGTLTHLADETGGSLKRVLMVNAVEKELGRIAAEFEPLYRVSFLTEISPNSKMEELAVSVPNRDTQVELIRLLPEEKRVPVSK
jgi:VWFA-related protein